MRYADHAQRQGRPGERVHRPLLGRQVAEDLMRIHTGVRVGRFQSGSRLQHLGGAREDVLDARREDGLPDAERRQQGGGVGHRAEQTVVSGDCVRRGADQRGQPTPIQPVLWRKVVRLVVDRCHWTGCSLRLFGSGWTSNSGSKKVVCSPLLGNSGEQTAKRTWSCVPQPHHATVIITEAASYNQ